MRRDIRRSGPAAVMSAVLALLLFAACGSTNHGSSGAADVEGDQPAANGTLAPAELVDLPKPGAAQVSDGPTEQGGAWTESFTVDGLSPAETMDFYVAELENTWMTSAQPAALADCALGRHPAGNAGCTYRGRWINGAETLEISASPNATTASDPSDGTELSLSLTGAG